ncbi:GNAT family N-acetyltransferase [Paraburkholderia rhizosphaerae]|uniref:Ribosomal protein S18 acetylase RimI-like enzyme n=1 Tax=Paraburkholderia rhizosphaerae TaxID=480658 RepID=A0A4R8L8X2_9BURK|nr:GNAT family N-acetyltransferase [Paraburkholderia rhizosphaerae]TDY38825.1 ribosomal protein S18 acetylase RimI-like enzyme [Paraburkholderia rhizosphaerae]
MSYAVEPGRDWVVRPMESSEIGLAIQWAEQEGWNPGLHDADCFRVADPGGFFVGTLRGEPIGSISAVRYGEHFGFIGLYIVKPEFRGRGFGYRIWQHAMHSLVGRNIGLDGVLAQQDNYRKSGFQLAHRNIRFQGVAPRTRGGPMTDLAELPFEQVASYDRQCFPAPRDRFLAAWIAQPDCIARAAVRNGRIEGYGVLRPCRNGYKIGPLFADNVHAAEELLNALFARCAGANVALDVPETNAAAVALAERYGMKSVFETARMYTKEQPAIALARMFGVTTFELG